MKFYTPGKLLDKIEDQDYILLCGVRIDYSKRGSIKKDDWGTGWIYEADDSFRSWCAIAYGFDPAFITDQEFDLVQSDGIVYLSRDRTTELRQSMTTQFTIIDRMSSRV